MTCCKMTCTLSKFALTEPVFSELVVDVEYPISPVFIVMFTKREPLSLVCLAVVTCRITVTSSIWPMVWAFFSLDVTGHAGQTAMYLEINDLCQWKAVTRSKVAAMLSSRCVDMCICNSGSAIELLTLR